MANENETVIETTAPDNGYQEYIDTINEMKKNTVSREMYDKERQEKKALLNSLVNGGGSYVAEEPPAKRETLTELVDKAFHAPNSIEAAKGYLALRERLMENDGTDPMVGMMNPQFKNSNAQYVPTSTDFAEAQRTAEALQYCLDKADGDVLEFEKEVRKIFR